MSLSIIGVITGLMLANFRGGQQSAELRFAAEILTNQLRELQTNALSGRLVGVCTAGPDALKVCEVAKNPPVNCTGGTCQKRVVDGYGIRLSVADPKKYTLFYDTDGDMAFDAGEELSSPAYVSTASVLFEASTVGAAVDVVFKPPSAQIFVNGSSGAPDTVELTLRHAIGNLVRHVTLYRIAGKIEHD